MKKGDEGTPLGGETVVKDGEEHRGNDVKLEKVTSK